MWRAEIACQLCPLLEKVQRGYDEGKGRKLNLPNFLFSTFYLDFDHSFYLLYSLLIGSNHRIALPLEYFLCSKQQGEANKERKKGAKKKNG
jgi:hypothetical protein